MSIRETTQQYCSRPEILDGLGLFLSNRTTSLLGSQVNVSAFKIAVINSFVSQERLFPPAECLTRYPFFFLAMIGLEA
jgi:hypothetical protein